MFFQNILRGGNMRFARKRCRATALAFFRLRSVELAGIFPATGFLHVDNLLEVDRIQKQLRLMQPAEACIRTRSLIRRY